MCDRFLACASRLVRIIGIGLDKLDGRATRSDLPGGLSSAFGISADDRNAPYSRLGKGDSDGPSDSGRTTRNKQPLPSEHSPILQGHGKHPFHTCFVSYRMLVYYSNGAVTS